MAEMIEVSAAGIILCGGQSTRMGSPKAWLAFGEERMLQRIVRILANIVEPIVVVAAVGQDLPDLPAEVIITRDEHERLGPLAGMAAGLKALREQRPDIERVYISSCDAPLLKSAFVQHVLGNLGDADIAIPREGKFYHPLAAAYRTSVESRVRELVAAARLRPFFLLEQSAVHELEIESLRDVDPELDSLRNTNTPEEYAAALQAAGITPDNV